MTDPDTRLFGELVDGARLVEVSGEAGLEIDDVAHVLGPRATPLLTLLARGATRRELRRLGGSELAERAEQEVYLERLRALGAITWTALGGAGRALARLVPMRRPRSPHPRPLSRSLSRFAHLRFRADRAELHSPLSDYVLEMPDPRVLAWLNPLVIPDSPSASRRAVLTLLSEAGFLSGAEDDAAEHGRWSFESLVFHEATRMPRRDRVLGRIGEAPRPEPETAEGIVLPVPDLARLERDDPPFQRVVERRRSLTRASTAPCLAQISELLFRAVSDRGDRKPYPSAGGLHPLTLYLALGNVEGIAPGLYRYGATAHALHRVREMDDDVKQLLVDAAYGTAPTAPEVLVVLASRVARSFAAYGPIAYTLLLKEVGVVMESLCLTATAMGMGACPIGTGDAARFARATGLNPWQEASVGELAIGIIGIDTGSEMPSC